MFSDKTYDKLLDEALSNAPDDVDTRQGSIYYDAIAGQCQIIARMYEEMSALNEYLSLDKCYGEVLDSKAYEHGISRIGATKSEYLLEYTGTAPAVGSRFFDNSVFFEVVKSGENLVLRAEEAGSLDDRVNVGDIVVPVNTIVGLSSAIVGNVVTDGVDEESDDNLRQRLVEKITTPSQNGNKRQFKTWCEAISGVGHARILPLENGPNTVVAVLIGADGRGAEQSTVDEVQKQIDPLDKQGLGEGLANIGCVFTAKAATEKSIAVNVSVALAKEKSMQVAKTEIEEKLIAYFKDLALDNKSDTAIVRLTSIGNILLNCDSIIDYSNLTLDGGSSNVTISVNSIPILGTLTVSAME